MISDSAYAIGLLVFGVIMTVGISLSAWKGEFNQKEYYCNGCCNPDHWSPEDREKAIAEKILIFDDISFCIGDNKHGKT